MLSFYKFCIHTCLSFVTKRMRTRSPSTNTPWWWTNRHLNWIRRENVFSFEYWSCHGVKLMRKGSNARRSEKCSVLRLSRQTRTENSLGNILKTCLRWILVIRLQSAERETKIFLRHSKVVGVLQRKKLSNARNWKPNKRFLREYISTRLINRIWISITLSSQKHLRKKLEKWIWGREAAKKLDDDWQKINVITKNDWKISSIM